MYHNTMYNGRDNRKQFVCEANWEWGYFQDLFDYCMSERSFDILKQVWDRKEFLCQRWKETSGEYRNDLLLSKKIRE